MKIINRLCIFVTKRKNIMKNLKYVQLSDVVITDIIERLNELNQYNLLEFTNEEFDFSVEYRLAYARSYAETIDIIYYLKGLLKENENTNHQVS